jgi:hypothetical protein
MRKSLLWRLLPVALFSSAAWAQALQNNDIFLSAGPVWSKSQTIGATNITLAGSSGISVGTDYGYQIGRLSAASLMLDLSFVFAGPRRLKASVPASGNNVFDPETLGFRLMVPVHSRLSFFAMSGGGFGFFSAPAVIGGDNPTFAPHSTVHGVFVFGGGADFRLSRLFSVRAEVRDFVTGTDLSGATGTQHLLPFFGVAIHF